MGRSASASEVERTLSAVAERALHHGARAGLVALVEAVLLLTEASGAALYAGGLRVAIAGLAPPAPERASALQVLKEGRTTLVLGEPVELADRPHLQRLVALGEALLACQAREDAARTELLRLRQERLRARELRAHQERARSRAAHDLRTPLLVLQGYVDMMVKGMAGALTPSMQRYLERMSRASGELHARLQQLLPVEDAPAEDLRPLLRATFGPGRRGSAALELPDGPVRVRAPRPVLELLIRTLGRLLAGAGASDMVLRVEAQDGAQWRVFVQARVERPAPERTRELLEKLTRRVQGQLSLREHPELELVVLLPRLQD